MPHTTTPMNNDPTNTPVALQPVIYVPDLHAALETYTKIGFDVVSEVPGADGKLAYAILGWGDSRFHLAPLGSAGVPTGYDAQHWENVQTGNLGLGVNFYLSVDDVQRFFGRCTSAGWHIWGEPTESFSGNRLFMCVDPFGYVWTFAQMVAPLNPTQIIEASQSGN